MEDGGNDLLQIGFNLEEKTNMKTEQHECLAKRTNLKIVILANKWMLQKIVKEVNMMLILLVMRGRKGEGKT